MGGGSGIGVTGGSDTTGGGSGTTGGAGGRGGCRRAFATSGRRSSCSPPHDEPDPTAAARRRLDRVEVPRQPQNHVERRGVEFDDDLVRLGADAAGAPQAVVEQVRGRELAA